MEELKSKIVWQEDKDFGKVCTLTESALNGIIAEATKGLEQQIEKMKNCRNCKNEKIEGACGHFTQVGWCKNWELAD